MPKFREALLSASALTLALTSSVWAADLGPVLKAKAPPAVPAYSWSGFYIGGHVGYGIAAASTSVNDDVNLEGMTTEGAQGALFGVQGGYNYQLGNAVVGIEGDWSDANLKSSNTLTAGPFTYTASEKVKWLASVRGRAGLAFDRTFLYGTAGAAWARADFSATDSPVGPAFQTLSESRTVNGMVYGGGVEWALWDNLALRAEYLHYDFGSRSGPTSFIPSPIVFTNVTSNKLDSIDVIRVGANYYFFKNPTPPAAEPMNWSGWYLGGHVGYGVAAATTAVSSDVLLEKMTAEGAQGGVYGVQGGYNYQLGHAVVGIEADWSDADLKSSNSATTVAGPFTFTASEKVKSLASVRGRAGIASDRLFLYGTAGVGWARAEFDATDTSTAPFQNVNESRTATGMVYGGGAEWALWNNLSLRAEYLHYDFGSSSGPTPFVPGAVFVTNATSNKLDSVDVIRVGANYYLFKNPTSPAVMPANWSGWYLGGHGGYGIAAATTTVNSDVLLEGLTAEGAQGAVYGVQGGYNYQFGHAVVGIEADWSGANLKSSNSLTPGGGAFSFTASEKVKWLASVRGRAGIAFDRLFLYGTAGVGWARAEFDATDTFTAPFQNVNESRTPTGMVYGGGAEWALWNNLSLRAEYLRYDFGSDSGPTPFIPSAIFLTNVTSNKLDSIDVVRVGASYRFGAGS